MECSANFLDKPVDLTIKLNTCQTDVTTTITVNVYSLGISYTYTFSSEEDVPIPGFSAGLLGGVYLRVKLTRENLSLKLEVTSVIVCVQVDDVPINEHVVYKKLGSDHCTKIFLMQHENLSILH